MLPHCLLTCILSDKKSEVLIIVTLYVNINEKLLCSPSWQLLPWIKKKKKKERNKQKNQFYHPFHDSLGLELVNVTTKPVLFHSSKPLNPIHTNMYDMKEWIVY